MKKLLLSALLLLTLSSVYCQEDSPKVLAIDSTKGKYTSVTVILVNSFPDSMLYDKTYDWLYFVKYAKTVGEKGIFFKDKGKGKIMLNQYFVPESAPKSAMPRVVFKLTFEFKDNKIRCTYTDFAYRSFQKKNEFESEYFSQDKYHRKLLQGFIAESEKYILTSIADLKDYLSLNDEW